MRLKLTVWDPGQILLVRLKISNQSYLSRTLVKVEEESSRMMMQATLSTNSSYRSLRVVICIRTTDDHNVSYSSDSKGRNDLVRQQSGCIMFCREYEKVYLRKHNRGRKVNSVLCLIDSDGNGQERREEIEDTGKQEGGMYNEEEGGVQRDAEKKDQGIKQGGQ